MPRPAVRYDHRRGGPPELGPPIGLEVFVPIDAPEIAVLRCPAPEWRSPVPLTRTEERILALLGAGLSSAAIARHRGRSASTVNHQIASLYAKLGVSSRPQLFARVAGARHPSPSAAPEEGR